MLQRIPQLLGLVILGLALVVPGHLAQARTSPVGFTIGDYAGDFVKEKETGRVWYIDVNVSRRYMISENDPYLFQRLKDVAQDQPWYVVITVPENSAIVMASATKKGSLKGLVYDDGAPDLLWHVQKRAYRRQALRSREDVLVYSQNALAVSSKDLAEYPIAYADFDYTIKDPAKNAATSTEITRPDAGKSIYISLREQRLRAYENGKLVYSFLVSTGKGKYPTPRGSFSVLDKKPIVNYQWSYGPDNPDNYDLGYVPYNLRVTGHKYIHYAYWHNNFGHTMSHGCINVSLANAKWIYRWADEDIPVLIK
ncbi:MAG: L,D-transpeptidase [Patescibacteria group bacterium]|nr:L,D-transpeptidase [Patescibacteria group bacterium]